MRHSQRKKICSSIFCDKFFEYMSFREMMATYWYWWMSSAYTGLFLHSTVTPSTCMGQVHLIIVTSKPSRPLLVLSEHAHSYIFQLASAHNLSVSVTTMIRIWNLITAAFHVEKCCHEARFWLANFMSRGNRGYQFYIHRQTKIT